MTAPKDSSNGVDIFMPIYIGDYLKATNRLSTEQHGAYLLLIMDYWQHGSLPNDDSVLARITRMTPDAWSNARSILQAYFKHEDGKWIHSRIEKELAKARAQKKRFSERAIKGADARWNKKTDASSNASSNASSKPQAMLKQCPSPSPSYNTPLTPQRGEVSVSDSEPAKQTGYSDAFEKFWAVYPNKKGKGGAWKAFQKADTPPIEELIAIVRKHRQQEQWTKDNGKFIPHPQTWLNQNRWEDDVSGQADTFIGGKRGYRNNKPVDVNAMGQTREEWGQGKVPQIFHGFKEVWRINDGERLKVWVNKEGLTKEEWQCQL